MVEPKTELVRNAIAMARRKELENFQRELDMEWMNNRMEDGRMGRSLALIDREAKMEKDYHEEPKTELVRNAIAMARRKELENFQRELDMEWMNNRMEDGRMGRSLALIDREAKMEKDYHEEPKTELVRNAIAMARRKELENFQRELDMEWMNNRMEDGRMGRSLALIDREAKMEKDYHERTDHAAIVDAKARREIDMGFEIAKVQREETNAFMRRHYLRERDPELRELTRKLTAGYVCRDLQQQMLHNQYRKMQEKADEQRAVDKLREALFSAQEADEEDEKEKREKEYKYGKELRQQLVTREQAKQCAYEDTLIEKKMLDDIIRSISDEDKRELEQKRYLVEKTRKEMETFRQARKAWKEKQTQAVIQEEKEIEKQQQAVSDRNAAIVAERKRRNDLKDALCERISNKILTDEETKQRRNDILRLLREQELLEKSINDDIAEQEKLERTKRETKQTLTTQMEMKQKQRQHEKEMDAKFLQQVIEKQREDDEKERQKQQNIREKNKRHCAELLKQIEEQRRKHQGYREDEINRARAIKEYQNNWLAEVSEERKRILKEHAPNLIGYLQAGVLKKEDLPIIREGANEHPALANLNIEALTSVKRPKRFAKCNPQCMIIRNY